MPGHSSSERDGWIALWNDLQQTYRQSWLDLMSPMTGPAEDPISNPWQEGIDLWTKFMEGAASPEAQAWAFKLADTSRHYLQWGKQLWKALVEAQPTSPEAWREAVTRDFKLTPETQGEDSWASFTSFWDRPLEAWRRVCSTCFALSGSMEKVLRGLGNSDDPLESLLSRWLSAPSLNYTHKWQEDVREWQRLWLEHGQALREYGRLLADITPKAREVLVKKLYRLASQGEMPETLRAFYDLWVDSGEEAYAEAVIRPEFIRAQAGLVNTLMAAKRQEQKIVGEVLSSFNLPSRLELDASHRRLHRLRWEIGRLRETLDESDLPGLREEVAGMRREIEALRAQADPPLAEKWFPTR
jgi:class III poly(R)-hydroxyalkanoic acid synthase PhaE subunit